MHAYLITAINLFAVLTRFWRNRFDICFGASAKLDKFYTSVNDKKYDDLPPICGVNISTFRANDLFTTNRMSNSTRKFCVSILVDARYGER